MPLPPRQARCQQVNLVSEILSSIAICVVDFYRLVLSGAVASVLGSHCRYRPSCSIYAREALKTHGFLKGITLASRRVARCHPFGAHGEDPVPAKSDEEGVIRGA